MATRTSKNVLAQFASRTDEPISKSERKVVNPAIFRALGRTLGATTTFAAFEATLTEAEWVAYAPLFEGTPAPTTRKTAARKTGARKATSKKASKVARTFDCGCTGIRQHLSASKGCGVAAERKAAKATA